MACGLWCVVCGPTLAFAEEILAGVAHEPFVLPDRIPLAGYSRRQGEPSTGVHDPVGVRALVFRSGTAAAALVSCDLLIVDERLFDAVRRRLLNEGLPEGLVLILAGTHTHSGPGAYGSRFLEKVSMGHFDPRVFDALVRAIVRAVTRAHAALAPVALAYGTARTEGLVHNRAAPEGPVDPELVVVGCYRPGAREPFAVLVNFAAHPTTLGAWNRELSADYPGVVVRELERRFPTAVGLFFAGAVADQGPVKTGEGFEGAERIGRSLADRAAALLLLATFVPESPDAVEAAQQAVALPPAQVRVGGVTLPRWLGRRFVDDEATLSVLAIGPIVFIGVPCDLDASLGLRLKQAAQAVGRHPVLVGFASDYIGYCGSEPLYGSRGYESSLAFNGPRAGELIVEELTRMLHRVAEESSRD